MVCVIVVRRASRLLSPILDAGLFCENGDAPGRFFHGRIFFPAPLFDSFQFDVARCAQAVSNSRGGRKLSTENRHRRVASCTRSLLYGSADSKDRSVGDHESIYQERVIDVSATGRHIVHASRPTRDGRGFASERHSFT